MCVMNPSMCACLLDIPRELACMKLGSRELYQPIHVYTILDIAGLVHTPRGIQQICCSTQTFALAGLMLSCLGTAIIYLLHDVCMCVLTA